MTDEIRVTGVIRIEAVEWGCEQCKFHTADDQEALAHSDKHRHSLAIRPVRTPEMLVCCRTTDPDPHCLIEPGHVIGTCTPCGAEVRIGPSSVKAMLDFGAQPICIQCFAELPPETVELRRAP